METGKLARLREEQHKAMEETEGKVKQFEKYKSDYQALQKRLRTLPDKLSHDIMVPFGKLAFMPGQIVHTNEVLVLLGDNWFAERSAKQAYDIAGRRIKELEKTIKELKDQKKLLEPRLDITSQLQAQAEGKGDYQEIVEEYDEEKERLWDEQHKVNVRRYHEQLKAQRTSSSQVSEKEKKILKPETAQPKTDEELWSRLEALEKQEEEKGELNSSFESDNDEDKSNDEDSENNEYNSNREKISGDGCQPNLKNKRVSWQMDRQEEDDNSNDDDDGSEEEDDEESGDEREVSKPVVTTILFKHTETPALQARQSTQPPTDDPSTTSTPIMSPGDIYKLFCPKPILKTTKSSSSTNAKAHNSRDPHSSGDHLHSSLSPLHMTNVRSINEEKVDDNENVAKSIVTSRDKAFTGVIKEITDNSSTTASTNLPPSGDKAQGQPRRVSKFKAQRTGQKSS